jgi:hypothetical protein
VRPAMPCEARGRVHASSDAGCRPLGGRHGAGRGTEKCSR